MAIPDTMQAAVLMAPKRPQLQQVQTPVPGPVDVLIEVAACAVCSTDVALIDHPLPGQLSFAHEPLPADFEALALDNKTIYTVRGEGWANVGRAITLLRRRRVNLEPLITHIFPLAQIEKAFETFTGRIGGAVKVVVRPNERQRPE